MEINDFLTDWNRPSPTLLVHTSGSTGKPKPMWVEKRRMLASAHATNDFLNLKAGDATLLCMPLDFIAGKMVVVRAIERDLRLISVKPSNHPLAFLHEDAGHISVAAMVPSQVWSSLQEPAEAKRLSEIDNIIIGGGAISEPLEEALRPLSNKIFSSYGMTETLSHIALRRINGAEASQWYSPMPGVSLSLTDDSCLIIDAPHLHEGPLTTNDIVELHADGQRFRIIGRKDNVICSGGIKLHIEEIEKKLQSRISCPFCITKRKDEKFGEVAIMLATEELASLLAKQNMDYESLFSSCLDKYERPKGVIIVPEIPLTATGKIDRGKCQVLIHNS